MVASARKGVRVETEFVDSPIVWSRTSSTVLSPSNVTASNHPRPNLAFKRTGTGGADLGVFLTLRAAVPSD
jgi:hypothetical protein